MNTSVKYSGLRHDAIKNKVANDYFSKFDHTNILGNIDFCVSTRKNQDIKSILWAEVKRGVSNIIDPIVQLVITIGKAKTYQDYIPPSFLGMLDSQKIVFIKYSEVLSIFSKNDINWNVAPSNKNSDTFKKIKKYLEEKISIEKKVCEFDFKEQNKELKQFILQNFTNPQDESIKIQVNQNNFTHVYQQWLEKVKPTIKVDWKAMNERGILSSDFFLADLLSENNMTLKQKLYVLLKAKIYEIGREQNDEGSFSCEQVEFTDDQVEHGKFWCHYERPPKEEYWDFIVSRRDLLVPQDIRERKGSFFTPKQWVRKSQEYLALVLGENWQNDYYIWDCCAGTGNLLNGLTNYRNVWASTIDKADVDVMMDQIENGGWKMFENHVFQFDFLNDDFSKCPEDLQKILDDKEKRKRLVIYINPPYGEATNKKTICKTGQNREGLASHSKVYDKYHILLGKASNEFCSQFLVRIYEEINGCILGTFSKLKVLQSENFKNFRNTFKARLERMFIVPANTFDNVKGTFPIGFTIWNLNKKEQFNSIISDIYDHVGTFIGIKSIVTTDNLKSINKWIKNYDDKNTDKIVGYLGNPSPDFQHSSQLYLGNCAGTEHFNYVPVTGENLIQSSIYFSVRQCISTSWVNDRDQFLYPVDGWQKDQEFQINCLIFTLFHGQNRITSKQGINYWIPFTEEQINCKKTFKSNFMSHYLNREIKKQLSSFPQKINSKLKKPFLPHIAENVYNAGLNLWKYYHSKPESNPDASYYDIRSFFQGASKGKMNNTSDDEVYMELNRELKENMKLLAEQIELKAYEYGFLYNDYIDNKKIKKAS